jgi:molecular chaperone DnaK (HSP70)
LSTTILPTFAGILKLLNVELWIKENDDGIVPSCVGLDPEGRVIVGRQARNQYIVYPERTVVSIKLMEMAHT